MSDTFLPGSGFDTYEQQDKVLVGLCGGTGCKAAVRILQQQGFAVMGAVVRLCTDDPVVDAAKEAAKALGIECITLNASELASQLAEETAAPADLRFPALLAALKTHEAAIVPWEDARGYSLTAFHREHPDIRDLAIVIGPEGGMSADEIARMKDCGCQSVTLGPRILRTETAGLCALSALFCLYGELE